MRPAIRVSSSLLGRRAGVAVRSAPAPLAAAAVRFLAIKPEVQSGSVAVTSKKKEATDLASVLGREIQFEKEDPTTEAKLAEIAATMEQFTVEDVAGTSRFAVTRTIGELTVRIDVDCAPVPTDDEEEEEEEEEEGGGEGGDEDDEEDAGGPAEGYRALISLTKGDKVVQIGAFVTDYLRIHRVTIYKVGQAPTPTQVFGGADESPVYAGPAFEELDDALQNGWYEFLSARGVDDALAEKIVDYAATKEQVEYVRWLELTREFVLKK